MSEGRLHVHPDIAPGAPPAVAKGEVFAQVAAADGVDERLEEGMDSGRRRAAGLRLVVEVVIDEPRFGDRLEGPAGDEHERRADVGHPHEARLHPPVERLVNKCFLILPHAEGVVVGQPLQFGARCRPAAEGVEAVPVDALLRHGTGHERPTVPQEPEHRLGLEADVGIDEQQVCGFALEKLMGQPVASPGDEALLVEGRQRVGNPFGHERRIESQDRKQILAGDDSAVAGCAYEKFHASAAG